MSNEAPKKQSWFSKHKKAVIIGGTVLVAAAVGGVLVYLNNENIKGLNCVAKNMLAIGNKSNNMTLLGKNSLAGFMESPQSITVSVSDSVDAKDAKTIVKYIDMGIRNLPKNQHASPEKLEQAKKLNILLQENQTLYNGFPRRYLCKSA